MSEEKNKPNQEQNKNQNQQKDQGNTADKTFGYVGESLKDIGKLEKAAEVLPRPPKTDPKK